MGTVNIGAEEGLELDCRTSPQDHLLRPLFKLTCVVLDITLVRFFMALVLLPFYICAKYLEVLPAVIKNSTMLLSTDGGERLVQSAKDYRQQEKKRADLQMQGDFAFQPNELLTGEKARGFLKDLYWKPHMERFEVCGASVNVLHEVPPDGVRRSGKKILLLHGNPSWCFMWRNVIPKLVEAGHEVYALDWLGHGASDKPLSAASISYELHMRTLMTCIDHFDLAGCYIAAHDWGGCIALCTLPHLPTSTISGLFLLNSFFPPRPADISIHFYLLYIVWFLSTGIFDGLIPEFVIMRYMSPIVTSTVIEGYSAPWSAGPKAKANVGRFAHIVPGFPDGLFGLRETRFWRLVEGFLAPQRFTNINAQASLAERNVGVRKWWANAAERKNETKVGIAFGENDPLLKGFHNVLAETIDPILMDHEFSASHGSWIGDAGHYPVEERPSAVAVLVSRFVDLVEDAQMAKAA